MFPKLRLHSRPIGGLRHAPVRCGAQDCIDEKLLGKDDVGAVSWTISAVRTGRDLAGQRRVTRDQPRVVGRRLQAFAQVLKDGWTDRRRLAPIVYALPVPDEDA